MGLIHGGDWYGFQREFGRAPIDFSSNISPLGLPEGVKRAACGSLETADRYPDPLCRELRDALSAHHGVPAKHIVCGNGAADVIFRLARTLRPKRALMTAPTFAEYAIALGEAGCTCERYLLREENGFLAGEDILDMITPGLDMVVMCEPNNPTGRTTPPPLLHAILDKCAAAGTTLVADECFGEFLEDQAGHTLEGELGSHKNLIIIKAFTKCYAMAGLRLGYLLCGDAAAAGRIATSGQPWAVSSMAQAAGMAALGETEYLMRLKAMIDTERPRLFEALSSMGLKVIPGQANYLLFYCGKKDLFEELQRRGILLRDCGNYLGLGPGWYRCAVRTPEENDIFTDAMREVL